jgi:hypothetical protein
MVVSRKIRKNLSRRFYLKHTSRGREAEGDRSTLWRFAANGKNQVSRC